MYSKEESINRYKNLLALKLFTENAHEIIDLLLKSKDSSDYILLLSKRFDLTEERARIIADSQIKNLAKINRNSLISEISEVKTTIDFMS